MTLAKGKFRAHLKKPIERLEHVSILRGIVHIALTQVSVESMADLRNKQPNAYGLPRYVALENYDALLLHPAPDKKMECRVDGSVRVTQ